MSSPGSATSEYAMLRGSLFLWRSGYSGTDAEAIADVLKDFRQKDEKDRAQRGDLHTSRISKEKNILAHIRF